MPAELLELLRFGTAILAGGIVAVIAQRIAFRHAQCLQLAAFEHEAVIGRGALVRELEENLARLHRHRSDHWPAHPTRLAWESVRATDLGTARAAVLGAYAELELVTMRVEQAWHYSQSSTGADGILQHTAQQVDVDAAIAAVQHALDELAHGRQRG